MKRNPKRKMLKDGKDDKKETPKKDKKSKDINIEWENLSERV